MSHTHDWKKLIVWLIEFVNQSMTDVLTTLILIVAKKDERAPPLLVVDSN